MRLRRTLARMLAAVLVAVTLPTKSPAQAAPTPAKSHPNLHQAWLSEVLDLDLKAAAAGYEQVARDQRPGNPERWVATARLLELQRLGITVASAPHLSDVPAALRNVLATTATPLPVDELLQRSQGAPNLMLQTLASEGGKLPALRPAVPAAEEWLLSQVGPSVRDRIRQRQQAFAMRDRSPEARQLYNRIYAAEVVRAELEGNPTRASALRTLHFADWHAPTVPGDVGPHLARVRRNLEAWIAQPDASPMQLALLRDLREAIELRASKDPAQALALLVQLPNYAEQLLAETPATAK